VVPLFIFLNLVTAAGFFELAKDPVIDMDKLLKSLDKVPAVIETR
jgi:hypothetical protein